MSRNRTPALRGLSRARLRRWRFTPALASWDDRLRASCPPHLVRPLKALYARPAAPHPNARPAPDRRCCAAPARRHSVECIYQLHVGAINCLVLHEGFCLTASDDHFLRLWPLDFSDHLLEVRPVREAAGGSGIGQLGVGCWVSSKNLPMLKNHHKLHKSLICYRRSITWDETAQLNMLQR
jgi:hypothetical protein